MIYFIYGQDSYRAKRKLEEIVNGYKKVHKSGLNLVYFDVEKNDFEDFHIKLQVNSMFSEKKLFVLNNVFEDLKFQESFLENIRKLEEVKDIIIVFEDKAPDQRTKFFKALLKVAKCQEFSILQPAMLRKWVDQEFKDNNNSIDFNALDLLINYVGGNLWQMSNEINKLSNYKKSSIIRKEDVELLIKPNFDNEIFMTIESIASKNKKVALSLMHKHIENGDNVLYLLSMIAYQFRNLLIIKELSIKGGQVKNSGLHPYVIQKSLYLAQQFSMEQLKKIYQKIFQIDLDIKTGKIEAETALDLLLSEI